MKKYFLTVMALTVISVCKAQNIKLKKGIVYLDKVATAKMEGHAGIFKGVELDFTDMDGKGLFRLRHIHFDTRNPFLGRMRWEEVALSSGEVLRFAMDRLYYGDKKIIDRLTEHTSADIYKGSLKTGEVRDDSEKIIRDSTEIAVWQQKIADRLKARVPEPYGRDMDDPVDLKNLRFSPATLSVPGTFTKYKKLSEHTIFQGNTEVGKVTKERDVGSETAKKMRYIFYKKLDAPFELKGKNSDYLIAAIAEFSGPDDASPQLFTFQDNEGHRINGTNQIKVTDLGSAQQALSDYLVMKGYL